MIFFKSSLPKRESRKKAFIKIPSMTEPNSIESIYLLVLFAELPEIGLQGTQ